MKDSPKLEAVRKRALDRITLAEIGKANDRAAEAAPITLPKLRFMEEEPPKW